MFYFFYASDKLTETHMITWILDVFKTLNHKWRIFSSNMCMTLKSLQMELIRTSTNIRELHAISFARNDFLSSIQGEQAVRALLKTENILKRLLKSKPESSSRIFFQIPSSYVHFVTNNQLNPLFRETSLCCCCC